MAHLPSRRFTANAAWLMLALMAFNLTRAAATLSGPSLAKASTATIRRVLIRVPAKVATSGRRITIQLPRTWPWQATWSALYDRINDPQPPWQRPGQPDHPGRDQRKRGTPGQRGRASYRTPSPPPPAQPPLEEPPTRPRWIEAKGKVKDAGGETR